MTIKSRIFGILFALPFMLGFGAVGIFSLKQMAETLDNWRISRDYIAVPARILSAKLESTRNSKGRDIYRARIRYEYEINGQKYATDRVNIDEPDFDNLDDYHAKLVDRMSGAQAEEQTVTAWVSPRKPDVAVLDREIRWKRFVLMIPFGLVFTLVGVGALGVIIYFLRLPNEETATLDKRFTNDTKNGWRGKKEWRDGMVKSNSRFGVLRIWFLAVFWNGISLPMYFGFMLSDSNVPMWAKIVFALFPIIGIGLLWGALKHTAHQLRHGETSLVIKPFPAKLGENASIAIELINARAIGEVFTVTWRCNHVDTSGSSSSRSERWSQALSAQAIAHASASNPKAQAIVRATLQLPSDLPASESTKTSNHHEWVVVIESKAAGFSEQFTVPVQR
jgi:hypothetical protein